MTCSLLLRCSTARGSCCIFWPAFGCCALQMLVKNRKKAIFFGNNTEWTLWRPLEPSHQGWTPLSFMIVKIHLQVLTIIVNNSWIRFVNQLIHPYLVLTNLDTLNNLRHQVHSLVFLFHLFGLIFFRLCGYVAVHWNQQNHHQESFTMTISLNLRLERSNCLPNFFYNKQMQKCWESQGAQLLTLRNWPKGLGSYFIMK